MSIKPILVLACAAGLASLFGVASAAAQVAEGEEHCVVNVKTSDVLNVRAMGNATSTVVTTLPYAECGITVTSQCNGAWCPIEDGHYEGWVNSRFISMVSPAMYCVTAVGPGDGLNLRAFPSAGSRIVDVLPPNQCDIAFLPFSVGNWQKVRVDGYEGWVNRKFLSGQ